VTEGTNTIVGNDTDTIISTVLDILENGGKTGCIPDLWDGKTAVRISDILLSHIKNND
jgi:UDP-N-acetylglucosamine 2-epimerase (non-hydrolysing)